MMENGLTSDYEDAGLYGEDNPDYMMSAHYAQGGYVLNSTHREGGYSRGGVLISTRREGGLLISACTHREGAYSTLYTGRVGTHHQWTQGGCVLISTHREGTYTTQ